VARWHKGFGLHYGVDENATKIYDECILNEPPGTPFEDTSVLEHWPIGTGDRDLEYFERTLSDRPPVIRRGNFWHTHDSVEDGPQKESAAGEESFVKSSHGFGFTQEVGLSQKEKTARAVEVSSINHNDDDNFPMAELESDDDDEDEEEDEDEGNGSDTQRLQTERELFSDLKSYGRELTRMAAQDPETQKIFREAMKETLAQVTVSAAKNRPAGPGTTTVGGTMSLPETETKKKARRLKPVNSPSGKRKSRKSKGR
jgi:hypothetical protein